MSTIVYRSSAPSLVRLHPDQPLIAQDSESKLNLTYYGSSANNTFNQEPTTSSIEFPIDEPYAIEDFFLTESFMAVNSEGNKFKTETSCLVSATILPNSGQVHLLAYNLQASLVGRSQLVGHYALP